MVKKRPQRRKKKSFSKKTVFESWVNELDFELVDDDDNDDDDNSESRSRVLDFRIISWNVLAQGYLSRRSHHNLPKQSEDVIFNPKRRHHLLDQVLKILVSKDLDILCLQEVDLELIGSSLAILNFHGVSTPTIKGGGAGSRQDACCVYWNNEDWELMEKELIFFDDLSTLGSNATKLESNLQGVKQSLLRRNVGIIVRLRHRKTDVKIVVVNAHLFWNPKFEYVKLCQAHYAMVRTKEFCQGDPVVVCGDLNSKPHGSVHHYLTKGKVNAKEVAPWYNTRRDDGIEWIDNEFATGKVEVENLSDAMANLYVDDSNSPQIRYMLDFTLNRFSRWLRILGIDAALETEAEEIQRTKHAKFEIFHRCGEEHRTLITTSSKLMMRKDCPPGAYLINPKTLSNLEACLVHVLKSHGVVLEPANFLSRCVVCNGEILNVTEMEEKKRIFAAHQAPELSDSLECFECNGCGQGYWWCDRPTSSASRVKSQATRLFQICLRGGVKIKGPLNMFDFVDVDAERKTDLDVGSELETLEVLEWMKEEELPCPLELESSYALRDASGRIVGESKPFSNVTADFVGLLDYVLFEPSHFRLRGRLHMPSSFKELNQKHAISNGHLLPSHVWPSDHLAVGSQLSISIPSDGAVEVQIPSDGAAEVHISNDGAAEVQISNDGAAEDQISNDGAAEDQIANDGAAEVQIANDGAAEVQVPYDGAPKVQTQDFFCGEVESPKQENKMDQPTHHQPRCACGCVPRILSLFEMAELRKQAKLAANAKPSGTT